MLPVMLRKRRVWNRPEWPMERMVDRLMSEFWPESWEELPEAGVTAFYPVDIREEDGKLFVDAELPGFKREEIDVSIENDVLKICAERRAEETTKGTEHLRERRYTRVERSFTLPAPVDPGKVEAKLQEGVLHLELHETEVSKARHIQVK